MKTFLYILLFSTLIYSDDVFESSELEWDANKIISVKVVIDSPSVLFFIDEMSYFKGNWLPKDTTYISTVYLIPKAVINKSLLRGIMVKDTIKKHIEWK